MWQRIQHTVLVIRFQLDNCSQIAHCGRNYWVVKGICERFGPPPSPLPFIAVVGCFLNWFEGSSVFQKVLHLLTLIIMYHSFYIVWILYCWFCIAVLLSVLKHRICLPNYQECKHFRFQFVCWCRQAYTDVRHYTSPPFVVMSGIRPLRHIRCQRAHLFLPLSVLILVHLRCARNWILFYWPENIRSVKYANVGRRVGEGWDCRQHVSIGRPLPFA